MNLSDLRYELLLPEHEIIINKKFSINNLPAIMASLTLQNDEIKIWIFYQTNLIDTSIDENKDEVKYETNRKEKTDLIQKHNIFHLNIQEITIQDNVLPIGSSSGGPIEHHLTGLMNLQHFLEKGIDFSSFEHVPFEQFMMFEYTVCENISFPQLDLAKPMPIVLKTGEDFCEVFVDETQKFVLPIGEHLQEVPYSYFDSETGNHIDFYINRISRYNIYEEYRSWFENEKSQAIWQEQGLDKAAIAQMEEDALMTLGDICAKDQDLLIIQYETPDDIQLNFYTTKYLDTKPDCNSNRAVGLLWETDGSDSMHGCNVRTDVLMPVSKDFSESVEIELFSWYRKFPSMEIKIS